MSETFAEALEARTQDVLDNCTRCGRCFEVCPMTELLRGQSPKNP
jgi:Fe-S oxidoreductase